MRPQIIWVEEVRIMEIKRFANIIEIIVPDSTLEMLSIACTALLVPSIYGGNTLVTCVSYLIARNVVLSKKY